MMKMNLYEAILYALSRYDYAYALRLAQSLEKPPAQLTDLLSIMAERRELNIQPALDPALKTDLQEQSGFQLFWHEEPADEQLANYLYDLEAKLRNEQIIDFIRAVSPAIYRIFLRLISLEIPDLPSYIHNSREASYDRWKFDRIRESDHPALQAFHAESTVNSSSLTELILLLDLPEAIKEDARELRELEKSVRNPLAHLIKAFDESELHRTTGFSSQHFMDILVELAQFTGIHYDREHFYFDQANALITDILAQGGFYG